MAFQQGHCSHLSDKKKLLIIFVITLIMMIVEFIGGWLASSLALTSDAGHMFIDVLALGSALFAVCLINHNQKDKVCSIHLAEIYAALFNGIILLGMAIFILVEAIYRFFSPEQVESGLIIGIAFIGLIVNLLGAFLLHSHRDQNINMRGVFLHIIGDTLSSVGVIIGGIIIYFTNFYIIDSILSFLIAVIILYGSVGLIRDSIGFLVKIKTRE